MIITCKNEECRFDINISDDKLPTRPVRINCPKCRTPNNVYPAGTVRSDSKPDSKSSSIEKDNSSAILKEVDKRLAILKQDILNDVFSYSKEAKVTASSIPEGERAISENEIKKALICDDDKTIRAIIKDSVAKLGFICDEAESVDKALDILSKGDNQYSLVLIDKVFPEDPEGGYKILAHTASLPIAERRKLFVVFISGELKTKDSGNAFLLGTNTLVNKKDLSMLTHILEGEMKDYKRLYSVFTNCLNSTSIGGRHTQ